MRDWIRNCFSLRRGAVAAPSFVNEPQAVGFPQHASDLSVWHKEQGDTHLGNGDLSAAEACYRLAIQANPVYGKAYGNLGFALKEQGRLDEAEQCLVRALAIDPANADVHYSLALLAQAKDKTDVACAHFRKALALNPGFEFACRDFFLLLWRLGRLEEAGQIITQSIVHNQASAPLHLYHGNIQYEFGKLDSAVASFSRALEIDPKLMEAYCNLGNTLHILGKFDDALATHRHALEMAPDSALAHSNLGNILHETGKFDDALACFSRALEIEPNFAQPYNGLGNVLSKIGRIEDAIASYRRALEIDPDYAEAHYNLGSAFRVLGMFDDAAVCNRRALEINPKFGDASFNLGLTLLTQGKYAEAWPHYESRFDPRRKKKAIAIPDLPFARWNGESLHGRSLLIWPEQGFGDFIQFARYASLLKDRGVARLTFHCDAALKPLLETVAGVDEVVTDSASISRHDFWSFPLSLPLHFATTPGTIPAKLPYLQALPERIAHWRERIPPPTELRVGLVWKGSVLHANDKNRSLPGLFALAPLWNVPGVTFISLQKGHGQDEVLQAPIAQPIVALGLDIADFADTAAIVANLDLVICIDTAVAHIAGAMNKPCWVLLPAMDSDWRWFQERADSPWYPGAIRLFRQITHGDWSDAIIEVQSALSDLAHTKFHQ
jgi:tetratricopeptide (TPR) repeat protein